MISVCVCDKGMNMRSVYVLHREEYDKCLCDTGRNMISVCDTGRNMISVGV